MIKIISPEQKVYTSIRRICIDLFGKDDVYDYIPPEGTPYPFVRIAEQFYQSRRLHKQDLNGDTQITLHIWHNNVRERGTLTLMMQRIEAAVIEHYGVKSEEIDSRVMEDNTTSITLLHGIVEFNIKRYKGEI